MRGIRRGAWILAVLAAGLLGCNKSVGSGFPDGLGPLDDVNEASFPEGSGSEPHPEVLVTVTGATGDYEYVHGKAYVHGSLAQTWEALRDPSVCADRRAVSSWSVTEDVEEGYDYSYRIHNVVEDVITVDFDITWRHGASLGTIEAPEEVLVNYKKTQGTSFIHLLAGSIVAYEVDDGVTALEIIEHLDAPSGIDPAVQYVKDLHAETVLYVRGDPLPQY